MSVQQRGKDSWRVSIYTGVDAYGNRQYKRFTVRGSRKDAERAEREARRALEEQTYVDPSRISVGEFMQKWLDSVRVTVRPSSIIVYDRVIRCHILPALGDKKLQKLSALDVQTFYSALVQQGLSPNYVRLVHAVLRKALAQAVKWNQVPRNVADLADLPKPEKKEMRVLTPEQARKLLATAQGDPLEALWVLALTTGLRQGELLALRWSDVNLEEGTLQVRQALQRVGAEVRIATPKTAAGRRTLALTPDAIAALRRHRKRQAAARLQVGPAYQDQDLIFAREDGTPLHQKFTHEAFKRLLRKAGLPDIRFHDLRHSVASMLLAQGIDVKTVQGVMGHSSASITLDVYGHLMPGATQKAAQTLADLLG